MDRSDLILGDLEKSDLLMVAVDEKNWDIVPEIGKMLLGDLQWDFDHSYSVVVILQASLESDFAKIMQ